MLWSVKGGRYGSYEQMMLDESLVLLRWDVPGGDLFGDLRQFRTRDDLEAEYTRLYPDASPHRRGNHVGQLWAYTYEMQSGDWVVLRMRTRSAVAVGEVTGPYEYRQNLTARHCHPAKWTQTDLPPDRFGQDLLNSIGAQKTIARVLAEDAEARVRAIAAGKPDPGIAIPARPQPAAGGVDEYEALPDLEEIARDRVRAYLSRRFTGHALAQLVDAVLRAQGYVTLVSPPGPDGGVDILAGAGPMGFGTPRLVVQVKSGKAPVDSGVLRELQGTMQTHNAQQGLLVSWGGFRNTVPQEARRSFFSVRLWDQDALISALLEQYERLDEAVRVELPLKQVWVLATREAEEDEPE